MLDIQRGDDRGIDSIRPVSELVKAKLPPPARTGRLLRI
jgi:hypothetical protein